MSGKGKLPNRKALPPSEHLTWSIYAVSNNQRKFDMLCVFLVHFVVKGLILVEFSHITKMKKSNLLKPNKTKL